MSTRKVLAWRLSNTMDAEFCPEALAGRAPDEAYHDVPTLSNPGPDGQQQRRQNGGITTTGCIRHGLQPGHDKEDPGPTDD